MDLLGIKLLSTRTLRGVATWVAPSVQVMFSGSGDARAASELRSFVEAIEIRAKTVRAHGIVFDTRAVGNLSASCLASFVTLVVSQREQPREARLRVTFRTSAEHWQERSFAAVRALDTEIVQIVAVRAA